MSERFKMAVAAHLLLRNGAGDVLFMRRANTGYADGFWSVPAGHVERGESLPDSCVREASEEIGVTLKVSALEALLVQHKRDGDDEERIDVFFASDLPSGQAPHIAEPDKCDAVVWAPMHEPPMPLVPYVDGALRVIRAGFPRVLNVFGFEK